MATQVDTLTIILVVVVALLTTLVAWFGPRRRHWQTHGSDHHDIEPGGTDDRG